MRVCQQLCVFQTAGRCELESSNLLGQPCGCVKWLTGVVRLGSPHRYYAPESIPVPQGLSSPLPDKPE